MLVFALLIFYINSILCEVDNIEDGQNLYKNVLELTDMKIDKDTIINRNFKLEKKTLNNAKQESDPDWSYASFPEDVITHVTAFKRNMTECLKEVQAADKSSVQRLSPKKDSPVNGECLIACVLKRNGVFEEGKINKVNLISLLSKFYGKDQKMMSALTSKLEVCAARAEALSDECRAAAELSRCTGGHVLKTP